MKRQDAVRPVDVCHAKSTDPEEKDIFFWLKSDEYLTPMQHRRLQPSSKEKR